MIICITFLCPKIDLKHDFIRNLFFEMYLPGQHCVWQLSYVMISEKKIIWDVFVKCLFLGTQLDFDFRRWKMIWDVFGKSLGSFSPSPSFPPHQVNIPGNLKNLYKTHKMFLHPVIDKSLNLEKSWEEITQ